MTQTPKKIRTTRTFSLQFGSWNAADSPPRIEALKAQLIDAQTFIDDITLTNNELEIVLSTPAIATVSDCIAQFMTDHPGTLTIKANDHIAAQEIPGDDSLELIELISSLE
ncbi:MAG: hypothetical protein AAF810_10785 [Cyanobacteria bacterium P01_D01_bin.36]